MSASWRSFKCNFRVWINSEFLQKTCAKFLQYHPTKHSKFNSKKKKKKSRIWRKIEIKNPKIIPFVLPRFLTEFSDSKAQNVSRSSSKFPTPNGCWEGISIFSLTLSQESLNFHLLFFILFFSFFFLILTYLIRANLDP